MSALLLVLKIIMWLSIVIAGLCLYAIVRIKLFPSNKQPDIEVKKLKRKPSIKMLNRDGDAYEDEWHTYIAGLQHNISKYDIGGFTGWIAADDYNKYDPNAMGVYNSFGKLLGYIPAKEVIGYRRWCDGNPQPCVGFIFIEENQLRGRVKVLRPCNQEFLQTEFTRYLQWVNNNYGSEYCPKSESIQFDIE